MELAAGLALAVQQIAEVTPNPYERHWDDAAWSLDGEWLAISRLNGRDKTDGSTLYLIAGDSGEVAKQLPLGYASDQHAAFEFDGDTDRIVALSAQLWSSGRPDDLAALRAAVAALPWSELEDTENDLRSRHLGQTVIVESGRISVTGAVDSTPVPRAVMIFFISSLRRILSKRAFSTFNILPFNGKIA
mgnify:CR=1 FL=1